MRRRLAQYEGREVECVGYIKERKRWDRGVCHFRTLLAPVYLDEQEITSHLWMVQKRFQGFSLHSWVRFCGTVLPYRHNVVTNLISASGEWVPYREENPRSTDIDYGIFRITFIDTVSPSEQLVYQRLVQERKRL